MKTKDMVLTGVFAAVICVFAPFTIPIGAVPISLATFAVYLAAAVLGTKKGTLAVLIYILIGMAGVPVFSGFAGGIGKILGVTGGYIIGYIPCAFAIGVFTERFGGKNYIYPLAACDRNPDFVFIWNGMVYGTVGERTYAVAYGMRIPLPCRRCN